jgi:hypothetical protein
MAGGGGAFWPHAASAMDAVTLIRQSEIEIRSTRMNILYPSILYAGSHWLAKLLHWLRSAGNGCYYRYIRERM